MWFSCVFRHRLGLAVSGASLSRNAYASCVHTILPFSPRRFSVSGAVMKPRSAFSSSDVSSKFRKSYTCRLTSMVLWVAGFVSALNTAAVPLRRPSAWQPAWSAQGVSLAVSFSQVFLLYSDRFPHRELLRKMTLLTFRPFLFLCFQCSITLFELQHTLREHRTILRE